MGIVGAVVIARWSWTLMHDTGSVLLDMTDRHLADEIREAVEGPGDAEIVDLHAWRLGPESHAAIVSVMPRAAVDTAAIRHRLAAIDELRHFTVEVR